MIEATARPQPRDGATSPGTVYLHIGTFKSGTSYLQSVLLRNRVALDADGMLFPTGDRRWGAQVRGVRDVLGMKGVKPSDGAWNDLVSQIHASRDRAIISMEFLSLATPETVQQIIDDLQPRPVEVILGARDLARVIPSAWQSMIKQGHGWSFEEFVTAVTDPGSGDPDAHRRFWHHHDLPRIVDTWAPAAGMGHLHLLTVPPSGAPSTLLWERFASIIGIEAARYDASQDQKSNFSLSLSDAELMRRINVALRPELDRAAFKRWATRFFANHVLRASSAEDVASDKALLTRESYEWAIVKSRELVTELERLPIDVVGSLDELVPPPPENAKLIEGVNEPRVSYPDGAVEMIVKLVRRLAEIDPELNGDSERSPRRRRQGSDEAAGPRAKRKARARARQRQSTAAEVPFDLEDE